MDIAAKINSECQNNAATRQTAEIPEKYRGNPELRKLEERCRGHKKYRIQRVEAINTAECQNKTNNGTRHTVPQHKEKFPEPDKSSEKVKIREICSFTNEQGNAKWKNTKSLRKHAEKLTEQVRKH
jgi:hypothetical protein